VLEQTKHGNVVYSVVRVDTWQVGNAMSFCALEFGLQNNEKLEHFIFKVSSEAEVGYGDDGILCDAYTADLSRFEGDECHFLVDTLGLALRYSFEYF
jgi:hypothetical protein